MSFLKISDPVKRDLIVKEFLELKKNIRDNFLSERTGEQQLQTDLSKFYRPITETQKATAREITEGLKPIREGIENLPQAITFPPTQPIGEEKPLDLGKIAEEYLGTPTHCRDKTYRLYDKDNQFYIGNKTVNIKGNDSEVEGKKYIGTPGLWELIVSIEPRDFTQEDYNNYANLMVETNSLHRNNDSKSNHPKSSKSEKWTKLLSPIWFSNPWHEGSGVIVIPSNPNALLERLDLLLASQEAGHTSVRNKLVSICDELKRQGVLNSMSYKNLISNIKK